jgi:HEAT repeat protein
MCCLTRRLPCLRLSSVSLLAAIVFSLVLTAAFSHRAEAVEVEWVMYQDPLLLRPTSELRFPPGLVPLWLQALERPERDLKRRAAAAITRGQKKGLPGLDATIEPLMRVLKQPDQDRLTRLTAVQALVALDARQAASLLFEATGQGDLDLAELVEPALARWAHGPMRDVWLERLAGEVTLRRMHVLAMRGLTALGEAKSLPRLLQLAEGRDTPTDVRLEAATALGKMQRTGLEEPARKLIQDKSMQAIVNRLVASQMLESHRGKDVEVLLAELATDPQPTVRAIALGHLYRIDPSLIMPLIDETITSTDVNVRRWGAEALIAQSSPEKLARLAPMLDDPDPDLRRHVCDAMVELSKDVSLHDAVIAQGRQMLAAEGWRGQEQAILLLVSLDDKSIVDRLLNLLAANRVEVHATAAWGLCQLDVASTAEPIFEVFKKKTEGSLAGEKQQDGIYMQLSHLAQAMGRMRHAPADSLLRKYIPKMSVLHPIARSAAIWALGHLHADKPDTELATQLLERATDDNPLFSENTEVRRMAAVALGRMKAAPTVDGLRSLQEKYGMQSALGLAGAWAIHEITGEEIPKVEPIVIREDAWFLTPIEKRDDSVAD